MIHPLEKIAESNPCPLYNWFFFSGGIRFLLVRFRCVEHEMVSDVIDVLQKVITRKEVKIKLRHRLALPDGAARVHNVSNCHLPKSREIIQRRYQ